MISIVLADDNDIVRRGVKAVLDADILLRSKNLIGIKNVSALDNKIEFFYRVKNRLQERALTFR